MSKSLFLWKEKDSPFWKTNLAPEILSNVLSIGEVFYNTLVPLVIEERKGSKQYLAHNELNAGISAGPSCGRTRRVMAGARCRYGGDGIRHTGRPAIHNNRIRLPPRMERSGNPGSRVAGTNSPAGSGRRIQVRRDTILKWYGPPGERDPRPSPTPPPPAGSWPAGCCASGRSARRRRRSPCRRRARHPSAPIRGSCCRRCAGPCP